MGRIYREMKNTLLGKVSRVLDIAVFVFTTIAIAGVFYEGMTLKWYDIVGVLVFHRIEVLRSETYM